MSKSKIQMNVKCLNTHVILRRSRRISDLILRSQPEAPSKGWFGRPLADFNSVSFRMTCLTFGIRILNLIWILDFDICHLLKVNFPFLTPALFRSICVILKTFLSNSTSAPVCLRFRRARTIFCTLMAWSSENSTFSPSWPR